MGHVRAEVGSSEKEKKFGLDKFKIMRRQWLWKVATLYYYV